MRVVSATSGAMARLTPTQQLNSLGDGVHQLKLLGIMLVE